MHECLTKSKIDKPNSSLEPSFVFNVASVPIDPDTSIMQITSYGNLYYASGGNNLIYTKSFLVDTLILIGPSG